MDAAPIAEWNSGAQFLAGRVTPGYDLRGYWLAGGHPDWPSERATHADGSRYVVGAAIVEIADRGSIRGGDEGVL